MSEKNVVWLVLSACFKLNAINICIFYKFIFFLKDGHCEYLSRETKTAYLTDRMLLELYELAITKNLGHI